jgi:hypothetical protein
VRNRASQGGGADRARPTLRLERQPSPPSGERRTPVQLPGRLVGLLLPSKQPFGHDRAHSRPGPRAMREVCCFPLIGSEGGVYRPARCQPIDQPIQRFPHETLGTPSGRCKPMTSDLHRRFPRRRRPWPTSWHAHRRLDYVPGVDADLPPAVPVQREVCRERPYAADPNQAPGQGLLASWSCSGSRPPGDSMGKGLTARRFHAMASLAACNPSSRAGSSLPPLAPRTVTATAATGTY